MVLPSGGKAAPSGEAAPWLLHLKGKVCLAESGPTVDRASAITGGLGPGPAHDSDVSLPELKMSTNLKMHLKPSVQDVWQNLDSGSTL